MMEDVPSRMVLHFSRGAFISPYIRGIYVARRGEASRTEKSASFRENEQQYKGGRTIVHQIDCVRLVVRSMVGSVENWLLNEEKNDGKELVK